MVHLLALYHHYSVIVELVLELYCETAKRILCYFTAAESKFFYENSLALIRTYAQQQVGKRTVDKEAEEEQYRDLLLLMELLTNLLSKVGYTVSFDLRQPRYFLIRTSLISLLPSLVLTQGKTSQLLTSACLDSTSSCLSCRRNFLSSRTCAFSISRPLHLCVKFIQKR